MASTATTDGMAVHRWKIEWGGWQRSIAAESGTGGWSGIGDDLSSGSHRARICRHFWRVFFPQRFPQRLYYLHFLLHMSVTRNNIGLERRRSLSLSSKILTTCHNIETNSKKIKKTRSADS